MPTRTQKRQLCTSYASQANHFVTSTPHLYSSITISIAHQLESLVRSLRQPDGIERKRVRSLSLRDFPYALNERNAANMIQLLVLLADQPDFSRLVLDRGLAFWKSTREMVFSPLESSEESHPGDKVIPEQRAALQAAFGALHNLRELDSIQDQVYLSNIRRDLQWNAHQRWAVHTKLERLTLYNPFVNLEFANSLEKHPNLRQALMVRPAYDEEVIEEVLKSLQTWRELIIVGHALTMDIGALQVDLLKNSAASLEQCCKISFWNMDNIDFDAEDFIRKIQTSRRDAVEEGKLEELPLMTASVLSQ